MSQVKTGLETGEQLSAERGSGERFAHALLFTGHMIDRADRAHPRFPASAEETVRDAIRRALTAVMSEQSGSIIGLAGGACGGDILFHEICEELNVPTRVLLGLPPEQFLEASVAYAGAGWIKRFHRLLKRSGPNNVLVMTGDRTDGEPASRSLWERTNLWMIDEAVAAAPQQSLLALWDGAVGDGPGGTEHFIQVARQRGLRVLEPIAIRTLLAL